MNAATVANDRLLKIDEAAEFLGIAVGTLYHWVSQQRVPVVRLSRRSIRFRLSELGDWASQHLVEPRSECGSRQTSRRKREPHAQI